MANQTITFNQPGIKIFMTDDYAFLSDQTSQLTVDVRNTGVNYLVLPNMYQVLDKNGTPPTGNTTNGTYMTLSAASAAKINMINNNYGGQEYSTTYSQYLSILNEFNSSIWPDKNERDQGLVYFTSKGYTCTYDTKLNSSYSEWPSTINSAGFWMTAIDSTDEKSSYTCVKINDFDNQQSAYDQYVLQTGFNGIDWSDTNQTKSDVLYFLSTYGLSSTNLYSAINNWNWGTSGNPFLIKVAYIGNAEQTVENVKLSSLFEIGILDESNLFVSNIIFKYNGVLPSCRTRVGGIDSWKILKILGNSRVDQGSGNTESYILVENVR